MMGIAISIPLQVIYDQGVSQIFQMLTVLNMMVMFLCITTSVAVFKLHNSLRYLLPLTFLSVVINNWWVGYVGLNYDLQQTSVANLMFWLLYGTLFEKNTRKVLLNPKLNWWKNCQRYRLEIPVVLISDKLEPKLIKKSFDISESGFFLTNFEEEELNQINVGENIDVSLQFDSVLRLRCEARIVRKCEQNGSYPAGIGLQFVNINSEMKSTIRRLSQTFKQQNINGDLTSEAI